MQTDIQVAKTLNDGKIYSRALGSLQQAVEKGSKSLQCYSRAINSVDLPGKVGHCPTNGFDIVMNNMDVSYSNLLTKYNDDPRTKEYIDDKLDLPSLRQPREKADRVLKYIGANKPRFRNLKKKQITGYFNYINKVRQKVENLKQDVKFEKYTVENLPTFKLKVKEIVNISAKLPPDVIKFSGGFVDVWFTLDSDPDDFISRAQSLLNIIGATIILIILAIITQSHDQSTRYPKSSHTTDQVYTPESNALIRNLPKLIEYTEYCHNCLHENYCVTF